MKIQSIEVGNNILYINDISVPVLNILNLKIDIRESFENTNNYSISSKYTLGNEFRYFDPNNNKYENVDLEYINRDEIDEIQEKNQKHNEIDISFKKEKRKININYTIQVILKGGNVISFSHKEEYNMYVQYRREPINKEKQKILKMYSEYIFTNRIVI